MPILRGRVWLRQNADMASDLETRAVQHKRMPPAKQRLMHDLGRQRKVYRRAARMLLTAARLRQRERIGVSAASPDKRLAAR